MAIALPLCADQSPLASLSISAPTLIELPALTAHPLLDPVLYGSLGVSRTNAVLVWSYVSGFPPGAPGDGLYQTNLFLSRLDQSGDPIESPPQLVASNGGVTQPLLVPSDFGFFMLYYVATNAANWTDLCASISADGRILANPVVLATNSFKYSSAASNGRTLFFAGGPYTSDAGLDFVIIGQNGGQVAKGIIPNASQETFAAASDGNDYLVVWRSYSAPFFRATRVLQDGSLSPTVGFPDIVTYKAWIAHGPSGYLALAGSTALMLAPDGTEIKRAAFPFSLTPYTVVYPEGADWVVFTSATSGSLRSYRINGSTLATTVAPYPDVNNFPSGGYGVNMSDLVTPFGPGRFLVGYSGNVGILTTAGVTATPRPAAYKQQNSSRVVASSFGYAVAWEEADVRSAHVQVLRLAKDGTRLDDDSIQLGSGSPMTAPICVFDGVDYVFAWVEIGSFSTHLGRIAATGEANVREQTLVQGASGQFALAVNRNTLYAAWGFASELPSLRVFEVLKSGALGPETLVHGQSLMSDGENLYSIGGITNAVHIWRIQPNGVPAETNDTVIGRGSGGVGISGPNGFAASWQQLDGRWLCAYFTNGVEQFRSQPVVTQHGAVALSADRLIYAVQADPSKRPYVFNSIDLRNGAMIAKEADLGTVRLDSVNLASAGADFFGVTDSVGLQMNFVGGFWVIDAATPEFAPAQASGGGVKTTLMLNPDRQYRIESSADLLNWNVVDVISGVTDHEVANSGAEKEFVRAVLVPQ